MSSTFTTPIRVFKRNNPTNNGVISPDNTGAVKCSQEVQLLAPVIATTAGAVVLPLKDVGTSVVAPWTIPAGSCLQDLFIFQTSAPSVITGGVISVNVLVTNPTTLAVTTTTIGAFTPTTTGGVLVMTRTGSATAAVAAICANVGPLDVELQLSQATISAITGTFDATFSVEYVARNNDGSITAYGSGYTNT